MIQQQTFTKSDYLLKNNCFDVLLLDDFSCDLERVEMTRPTLLDGNLTYGQ